MISIYLVNLTARFAHDQARSCDNSGLWAWREGVTSLPGLIWLRAGLWWLRFGRIWRPAGVFEFFRLSSDSSSFHTLTHVILAEFDANSIWIWTLIQAVRVPGCIGCKIGTLLTATVSKNSRFSCNVFQKISRQFGVSCLHTGSNHSST